MTAVAALSPDTLPSLVSQAAAALSRATSAAEVLEAGELATTVYDAAKRAARLQKAKGAHDELVQATYRVQADSLEIESLAKSRLAKEYDAAQARGEIAKRGGERSGREHSPALPSAEDIGLDRKQIHDARQMRDAIEQDPGIVRRALDAMLEERVEPTRAALRRAANLRAAIGTDTATAAERGNNLYETPPEAMRTLLSLMRFSRRVLEPACGRGAISRMLEDAGYDVELSDLVDYGTADRDGVVQRVADFLTTEAGEPCDIVTNPPYGAVLNAFVAHALRVHRPRRMALLLNLNFMCGFDDPDRCFAMDECAPARVYIFSRRLPMMHRDGWEGPEASSRMNTAWFVWEWREVDGEVGYGGPTEMLRVDWKVFENAKPCGPLEQPAKPKRRSRKAVPA